jgi:hypothetical protein
LIELESQYEYDKNRIINEGEDTLDELRRQIAEYLKIIEDAKNQDRELNAEEIERQCDELFGNYTPIPFKAKKGNELDSKIAHTIIQENIRIPVINIGNELYFIGTMKVSCYIRGDNVVVRVGGGQYNFEEWVPFNHRIFERMIVINMINSGQTMEWVIEQLIQGVKIKPVIYPLGRQQTGIISSPEREQNSPRRDDGSPSRFTNTSPQRNSTNRSTGGAGSPNRQSTSSPRGRKSTK